MKKVAMPLAVAALAAGLLAANVKPASAAGFSFTPSSGTMTYSTATDTLTTKLFDMSGDELIILASAPNGISTNAGGSYGNIFDFGSFQLLHNNSIVDSGNLSSPFALAGSPTGGGAFSNFLFGGYFTDVNGNKVTFNGFTVNTSDSILNNTTKNNVTSGSGTFGTAPVPEMSSMVSFGALLMLGGLLAIRRRRIA